MRHLFRRRHTQAPATPAAPQTQSPAPIETEPKYGDPILSVRQLEKRFQIHQIDRSISVLRNVSFEVHPARLLRVAGPNGAGKSSLLRCIYRTYLPTHGSIIYQSEKGPIDLAVASDIDIAWLRRHELGFVTQFLHPRPRVTALELVAEPLIQNGIDPQHASKKAKDTLANFGLREALWNAYPATFSGGEQQKVNLARGLILSRRLLLLDEPTASLDATARNALAARLKELKSAGVSMIAVAHHPEDIQDLIDQTIELKTQNTQDAPTNVVA